MSVKGLMTVPGETLTRSTTVMDTCRVMQEENVGALAVVDGTKLCGILTYRDVVRRIVVESAIPRR